jgi:hypothetical protein
LTLPITGEGNASNVTPANAGVQKVWKDWIPAPAPDLIRGPPE